MNHGAILIKEPTEQAKAVGEFAEVDTSCCSLLLPVPSRLGGGNSVYHIQHLNRCPSRYGLCDPVHCYHRVIPLSLSLSPAAQDGEAAHHSSTVYCTVHTGIDM